MMSIISESKVSLTVIFFFIFGALAIASAIVTISAKNPVMSAISLVFHFFMLAGLYLTLNAQFIAVIQVLVYAGAIMVLVIFVIMLLNLKDEEKFKEKFNFRKILAVLFTGALVLQILAVFLGNAKGNSALPENAANLGSVESLGTLLFTDYMLPFEAIAILLLAAIIGAVIIAKKKLA